MTTTTRFDLSLLFFSTNPNSPLRVKFPSCPSPPTVLFGGKPFKSLLHSLTAKALSGIETLIFDMERNTGCRLSLKTLNLTLISKGGLPFRSSTLSVTSFHCVRNGGLEDFSENTDQECTSHGRRTLLFMISLLPTLQKFPESYVVNAADYGNNMDVIKKGKQNCLRSFIKREVRKVLSKAKAAGVLRLVFHDAGTYEMGDNSGGMNGSIVYELDRAENGGLKKPVKVLEKAKSAVEMIQPVSWADMIAVAGAEAVSLCGGPCIPVQLGRLDSEEPDPEGKLPEETLDAFSLKQCFQRKGFSTQELVALSGAHTLGSKGFGSPTTFDNSYFKILLERPWSTPGGMSSMVGLPSDHALVEDDECLRWISKYSEDQNLFFEDFKNAYIKLVNSGAKWRTKSV